MPGLFRTFKEGLRQQVARYRHRAFFDSVMAAAALVSQADGKVTFSERSRIDAILGQLEELSIFDVHDAVDLMNAHVEAIRRDPKEAVPRLLKVVAGVGDDAEAAATVVRICLAISTADDEMHPKEKARIERICRALGLTASGLGLTKPK